MKKIIYLIVILQMAYLSVFAQNSTDEGNVFFEVGISPLIGDAIYKGSTTGLALLSTDGTTLWSIGAEGGYFVSDDLALKVGLGYSDIDVTNFFSYKVGVKYYATGKIPLQLDITGASQENIEGFDTPDPLWLGIQGGYAAFITDNIALEPTLRYNVSLNSDYSDDGIFELRFGFVIFF